MPSEFSGLERAKKLSVWHSANIAPSGEVGRKAKPRKRVAAAREGRLQAMLEGLLAFRCWWGSRTAAKR